MTVVKPNSNLVPLVLIAIAAGGLIAYGFGDYPLKQAQANKLQSETEWQTTLNTVELPLIQKKHEAENQAAIATLKAHSDADVARINEVVRMEQARNTQRLENEAGLAEIGRTLLLAMGLTLCTMLGWALFRLASRIPVVAQTISAAGWGDLGLRRQMREIARERERRERALKFTAIPTLSSQIIGSNGHHHSVIDDTVMN